ncbi:tRNA lysidine(34) synthetase TilS [Pontibacterium granulatum]|uniref:tRNA lysidine(34) synthetase TilS n=1 Tax=Pontibacterium granulatum TaxID=2036029 RepID=UPI002499FD93|nr:tRNA lysidine(34) synthetase TilS [Pontibacterium granulatum]MDI3322950.1 tRNA lysidine(34) synthetase TilS [Pontibacterium granulatum]
MSAVIEQRFKAQLQQMPEPKRWLIGHSGGLDSQVLLHLASKILPPDRLLVVHINHHLQQPADSWAAFSLSQAELLGLKHTTLDVYPKSDSEDDARRARYAAFDSIMTGGDCLLLAHHGDDQVETLLFRLLRGAGLKGLSGIPKHRDLASGKLYRPLLATTRQELEAYAEQHGLQWVSDPSNQSDLYDRNFLRLKIVPLLEQRWPGFRQQGLATVEQLRASHRLLDEYLDRDLAALIGAMGELQIVPMAGFSEERQHHLLRRWVELGGGLLLNKTQLLEIQKTLIAARVDAQPQLRLGDLVVRRYQQALYLTERETLEPLNLSELSLGEHVLGDGCLLVESEETGLKTLDGIYLERRKGGERCRPVGRSGSCTVKKLLQEAGIPPWLKAHWPLLKSDDEVVAVPGICVCENWDTKNGGFNVSWHSFALSRTRSFGIL